jgi:hypothetical protein
MRYGVFCVCVAFPPLTAPKFTFGCIVLCSCCSCPHACPCHPLLFRPPGPPLRPPRPRPCCYCCCFIGCYACIICCYTGGLYITCAMLLALCVSCACRATICCCCTAFVAVRLLMLPCDAAWPNVNCATDWLYCASSVACCSSVAFMPYPACRSDIDGFTRRYSFFHQNFVFVHDVRCASGVSSHLSYPTW